MLLYVIGDMAVTRKLDIEFLAPVLLQMPYEVSAILKERDGRKLHVAAEVRAQHTGDIVASAEGVFIVVDLAHFIAALRPEIRARESDLSSRRAVTSFAIQPGEKNDV
ncbi:PaaI family thioesterase [Williamsia sp.]|uniref:PaaI family thioesterase n=1 Tax=Williamsia sp. TaxID=1872085 RepID=UPI0025E8A845|nr:PaaI family thioesterase [Williamsia sp.]